MNASVPIEGQDEFGQGPGRCRNIGIGAAEQFMERLVAIAARAPLTAEDIRNEFLIFRKDPGGELAVFADAGFEGCRKVAGNFRNKRLHTFERAVIARFEKRFHVPTPEGHLLSRRAILGFMYAMTRALSAETFRQCEQSARAIAASVAGDAIGDPRMGELVNGALIEMVHAFDGEFLEALNGFVDVVNSRLTAPRRSAWDAQWELNRAMAVLMLDDLYADLRGRLDRGELPEQQAAALRGFFAGLDVARRTADRPWLKRKLTL